MPKNEEEVAKEDEELKQENEEIARTLGKKITGSEKKAESPSKKEAVWERQLNDGTFVKLTK